MSQLEADDDLKPLRGDPRFASLLPKPDDFANPFVECVHVVREWDGEAVNDQFGWIARNIGDVDGDGVADVVTSAPTKAIGGDNAGGRLRLFNEERLAAVEHGRQAGRRAGTGVEGAGDTNGDGVPDVIASAPGAGAAYVYSGRDGRRRLLTFTAKGKGENFGRHAAAWAISTRDGHAPI